jgi:hypothetical protein
MEGTGTLFARGRCQDAAARAVPYLPGVIGRVFVTDPEGKIVEFMQADRGIFAKYHS